MKKGLFVHLLLFSLSQSFYIKKGTISKEKGKMKFVFILIGGNDYNDF
jgi:hypothetical protein